MNNSQNVVTLGYHSPTEWVFYPEVPALYSKIRMNKTVYDKTILEQTSESLYRRTKAENLLALKEQGRLEPVHYEIEATVKDKLNSLMDIFFIKYQDDMYALAVKAFDAFISHERQTLKNLMRQDDPHWKNASEKLPGLEKNRELIKSRVALDQIPNLKAILTKYFEDCLFTPLVCVETYNPIFQWEGYAYFEEWLLNKRKRTKTRHFKNIQKGGELTILKSWSEIILPHTIIRDSNQISALARKWEDFAPVRELIANTNNEIWQEIAKVTHLNHKERTEFVKDFERFLQIRSENVASTIQESKQTDLDFKSYNTEHKIAQLFIQTIGSEIPCAGGLTNWLSDLFDSEIENSVKNYSPIAGLFEYERIVRKVLAEHTAPRTKCEVVTDYTPIIYWNEV